MKIILQLVVLMVGLTGFYMMIGQAVPQKEVHPPEVIEIASDISTAETPEPLAWSFSPDEVTLP